MKILLLSHISDNDGVTPVILSKLAFGNIDYLLLNNGEIDDAVAMIIKTKQVDNYDLIFITDLSINLSTCNIIDHDEKLKNKIKIFDHHISNIFVNDFSFGTVIDINEKGEHECGTSLYYKFLLKEFSTETLSKKSVAEFVELVRQLDTWEWFNIYKNYDAKKLGDLFDIYGNDYYIDYYYKYFLNNDSFKYTEKEIYLLNLEQIKINRYILEKEEKMIYSKIKNYNVGIIFAEKYQSELGNIISDKYKNEIDFVVIINVSSGISYRGVKDIDLSKIATVFGGGGHKFASGSPLPENLKESILNIIFGSEIKIVTKDEKVLSFTDKIKKY